MRERPGPFAREGGLPNDEAVEVDGSFLSPYAIMFAGHSIKILYGFSSVEDPASARDSPPGRGPGPNRRNRKDQRGTPGEEITATRTMPGAPSSRMPLLTRRTRHRTRGLMESAGRLTARKIRLAPIMPTNQGTRRAPTSGKRCIEPGERVHHPQAIGPDETQLSLASLFHRTAMLGEHVPAWPLSRLVIGRQV